MYNAFYTLHLTSYYNFKPFYITSLAAIHLFEMRQHTRVHTIGNSYGNTPSPYKVCPCFGNFACIFPKQMELFTPEIQRHSSRCTVVNHLCFPTSYTHQRVFLNFEAIWQCLAVINSKPRRLTNSGKRATLLLSCKLG